MPQLEPKQIQSWLEQGTERFAERIAGLPDADFRVPSRLPGWTRAHVIAHLVANAGALLNLVAWARTGVQTPMYPSPEERDAQIEEGAQDPPEWLRAEFADSARRLSEALAGLGEAEPDTVLTDARGAEITARDLPWERVVEVWLHLVDLNAGDSCADLPAELVDALLDRAAGDLSQRPGCPALHLVATDRRRTWEVAGEGEVAEVTGPAADLLGWLTGRERGTRLRTGTEREAPRPPAWR
ncbi:maleylpyruvate isomerase family mycothiol-dependent enzyme [Marinactinospora thermotolerans]|uniref:Maleylpyruvate isomerase n=1 Tax=Marinactinospora thermotolerans DSM 45154 TaxID=1122192 RepID=A0A1T4QET9_9ACTN|nr:maleylpyruvate isomerase family mycothiol-dependent enzyme [Marinactinospora thermotolerans]SKA02021.1 maleylpyruvate isomerase [Marinactinospora thermotolerans DSM 45154]